MRRVLGIRFRNCLGLRSNLGVALAAVVVGAIAIPVGVALAGPLSASRKSSIENFVKTGLRLQDTARSTWLNEINSDATNYHAAAAFCSPGAFADSAKHTKQLGRVMQRRVLQLEHAELPLYAYATVLNANARRTYRKYLNEVGMALDAELTAAKDVSRDAQYVTAGNCDQAATRLHNDAHILMLATTNAKDALAALRLFAQSN